MPMLNAIESGNFTHDWVTVKSGPIVFRMSQDAIKVNGVRDIVTPIELSAICSAIDCVAPTAYLLDLRATQASAKTEPVTLWPKYQGKAMGSPNAIKEHSSLIDKQLADKDLSGGVSVVGKHWIHPLRLERLHPQRVSSVVAGVCLVVSSASRPVV